VLNSRVSALHLRSTTIVTRLTEHDDAIKLLLRGAPYLLGPALFFGLHFKYFIILKTLELGVALSRCPHSFAPIVATVFWLQATDQRRNSWL